MKYIDVERIGTAQVVIDIVPKGNKEIRPEHPMNPTQIAIHNTGNAGRGANAKMHNRYIHNLASYHPKDTSHISWHLTVDDTFIYQHIPLDENAWHTGDGGSLTSGNRTAIGIEICENPDMNYAQAEENAVLLTAYLLKKFPNIPVSRVKAHQEFSGKYCPRVILKRDGNLNKFRQRVASAGTVVVKEATAKTHTVVSGDTLWAISKKHGLTVKQLEDANKDKRLSPLVIGTRLTIPGAAPKAEPKPAPKPAAKPAPKPTPKPTPKAKYSFSSRILRLTTPRQTGADVLAMQKALASVYFYPEKGAKNNGVDGVFGPKTQDALKRFQSVHGLTADGIFGAASKRKLLEVAK